MSDVDEPLERIKRLVGARLYRVRIHAVRHMIEEGFSEQDIVSALIGKSRVVEQYPDELRCLLLGYFSFSDRARSPLHVVCDYSSESSVDIITAYIPQKPWWVTSTRRGRLR